MEEIVLTPDQQEAYDEIVSWNGRQITVGGYAGTGKTTLIKQLLKHSRFDQWAVASFTGKAVDVLRNKGIARAQTIHSMMYSVKQDRETYALYFNRVDDLGKRGVIIDEASMVDMTMLRDLKRFDVPVIWVGDMGQLEPIGEDPQLMADPDIRLEQIHRQALQSPIVRLSFMIRQDTCISDWFKQADGQGLIMNRQSEAVYSNLVDFATREGTMVICGFNRTRKHINEEARKIRGYTEPVCCGDKLMCLANNREMGVFNGMVCTVQNEPKLLEGSVYSIDVKTDDDAKTKTYRADMSAVIDPDFDKRRWMFENKQRVDAGAPNDLTLWDYAYAITCHKAQGSEADEVAVWDQQCDAWDSVRWRYTAVTRAKKKLIYCV